MFIFFFKYYFSLSLVVLKYDEFSSFERKNVINASGIVFLIAFIVFFIIYQTAYESYFYIPDRLYIFFFSLITLTLMSFYDDYKGLDPIFRLIVHVTCIYFSLATVPHIINFLPIKVSILISVFFWVYFMNITNFIDGADGFCITVSIFFFLSVLVLCVYYDMNLFSKFISIIILPILIVFLFFNAPPAKMFMGDTGAIFLGFLIGYCIIELSYNNFYFIALSAFSYPIVDCSLTLLKKILKGHMPWARLGDYYFLLPKKRKKNLDFLIVEKKIFTSNLFFSSLNFLIILISIYYDMQILSLLNFLSSGILLLIYWYYK